MTLTWPLCPLADFFILSNDKSLQLTPSVYLESVVLILSFFHNISSFPFITNTGLFVGSKLPQRVTDFLLRGSEK